MEYSISIELDHLTFEFLDFWEFDIHLFAKLE